MASSEELRTCEIDGLIRRNLDKIKDQIGSYPTYFRSNIDTGKVWVGAFSESPDDTYDPDVESSSVGELFEVDENLTCTKVATWDDDCEAWVFFDGSGLLYPVL